MRIAKRYCLCSNPLMSLKLREEVNRKGSHPPVDRFGVHFEYQDLCARLQEVAMQRKQSLNASLKPVARKLSRVQLNRSVQNTYGRSEQLKRVLRGAETQDNESRGVANRSATPNKQMGRKPLGKLQPKLKLKTRHVRQASLPILEEPLPQKPGFKLHKKSASIAWNTHNIYSTVDF